MPSFPLYMVQDGAYFYAFRDADLSDLVLTRVYPHRVLDFDNKAAAKARDWFIRLCPSNQRLIWSGNES